MAQKEAGVKVSDGIASISEKDMMGWAKISGVSTEKPYIKELLRSIFWTPPHPAEIEITPTCKYTNNTIRPYGLKNCLT